MMKVKNKKTGELGVLETCDGKLMVSNPDGLLKVYGNLKSLVRDWEDGAPLIHDEPLRKAIQEWATAHSIISISYHWHGEFMTEYGTFYGNTPQGHQLRFETDRIQSNLIQNSPYPVNVLCGGEE